MKDNPRNYRKVLNELEDEMDHAEQDFQDVKEDNPDEELGEKQQRAEQLMDEIHDQIEFLEEQMERIDETD